MPLTLGQLTPRAYISYIPWGVGTHSAPFCPRHLPHCQKGCRSAQTQNALPATLLKRKRVQDRLQCICCTSYLALGLFSMGQVTGERDSGPQADCTRPWQDTRAPWAAGEPLSSSQAAAQPLQAAAAAVGGATTIGQSAQLPHTTSAAARAAPTMPGAATPQPSAGTASIEAMPAAPSRGNIAQPGAVDVSQADTGAPWAASLAFRQPRPGPDAAGVAQAGEAAPQSGPGDGVEPSCAAALPTTSAAALRNSHRIAEPPAGQHNRPLQEAQPNRAGPAPAPVSGTAAPWARPAGAHALVGQPVEPVVAAEPRMPAAARPLPPTRAPPQRITDAQTLQRCAAVS